MKNLVASFLILCVCLCAASCTSSSTSGSLLLGEWKSDHDLTMNYIRKNARPEKKADEYLDQMFGHLTLTFGPDHVKFDMPAWDAHVEDKTFHMARTHEDLSYQIASADGHTVVVSTADRSRGATIVTTYHFDNRDTVWVASAGADQALPISRYREYFRRVH